MPKKIASKDEERTALAKIREIVDSLGENSYIAIAMEGMWELIEENITDDFGNSHMGMIAYRDKEIERLNNAVTVERDNANRLQKELNNALERITHLEATIEGDNKHIERLLKDRGELEDKYNAVKLDYKEFFERADNEICHLKASLYDYMAKEDKKGAN